MSPKLGIVTGLKFEADILKAAVARHQSNSIVIACEGPGAVPSRRAAESLIARGATHLLSFGIAAALDQAIRVGDVIVATAFRRASHSEVSCDRSWADRLVRRMPDARFDVIAHSADILSNPDSKAALRAGTGAALADMESYGMAAAAAGRPCAAIRVISDTAAQSLPPAAVKGANANGTVSIARVLTSVAGNPCQIPALVRLGLSTGVATRRLRALADLGAARGFFVADE